MLKSENLSVYRIIILSLLCFYIQNIWIFAGCVIYLFVYSKRNLLVFVVLLGILFLSLYLHKDFIPVGIIDYKQGNYYICDKGLYKVKVSSEYGLLPGDILHFKSAGVINEFDNQRSKNILYLCDDYTKVYSINIRNIIHNRVNSFDNESKTVLNKVLYNINDYENYIFNLGYGLMSYYFFMFVFRKNKYISIFLMSLFSLCFFFDVKFLLIILEFVLGSLEVHFFDKFTIKMYLLALINKEFISNYSLIIPLLISLYGVLKINIHFRPYMSMVMMTLFHEIDPVSSLLFPLIIKIQSGIFALSIIY